MPELIGFGFDGMLATTLGLTDKVSAATTFEEVEEERRQAGNSSGSSFCCP
jgi:hypothetical protein